MQKRLILTAACLSVFFEALDVSVTALALSTLKEAFHVSTDKAEWLQTIYVLFYAGFLILGGRLADIRGRKNIYLLGFFLFLIASLLAGFCTSINVLIICRSIQGIGAAFAIPAAISIITNLYSSEKEVNKALGIFGSFAAMGFASGLMAGGVVIKYASWKWIFWMNVPIIAAVILIAIFFIPNAKPTKRVKNDLLGGLLLTGGIIAFTYAVHLSSLQQLLSTVIAFIISIIILIAFYRWEKQHSEPLIDMNVFDRKYLRQINFTGLMLGASFISYVTFLSIHLQQVLAMSSAAAGVFLFPFSIGSAVVARFLLPVLQERTSLKNTALIGFAFLAAGCALLSLSLLFSSYIILLLSVFCVNAVAISILYPSITALSMAGADKHTHGLMAGLQSTSYSAGCGIGIAFIWTIIRMLNGNAANFAANTVITAMILIFLFCIAGSIMLIRTNENTHSYQTRQK